MTGATGNIGREVVAQLRSTGCQIRALSRNPQTANLPDDVEVVRGDLSQPETLERSLEDVDAVFLVWVAPISDAAASIAHIGSRTERIVLLTSPHRTPHPFFQQPNILRSVHAEVERLVQNAARRWTLLRSGVFAINCLYWWAPQIIKGNVVRWFSADAETAPIHERDIASVAVRTLCDEGHDGKEYVLTGPESLTQREQVNIIGKAIGRPLRYDEMPPESAREELSKMMPPAFADMLFSAYRAAVGQPAFVTSNVATITGKPARRFDEWAVDHARDFSA